MEPDWKRLCAFPHCSYKTWLLSRTVSDVSNENSLTPQLTFASGGNPVITLPDKKIGPNEKVTLAAYGAMLQSANQWQKHRRESGGLKHIWSHNITGGPKQIQTPPLCQLPVISSKGKKCWPMSELSSIMTSRRLSIATRTAPNASSKILVTENLKTGIVSAYCYGMSAKVLAKYHSKGMFTITQLSHIFRPRRRGRRPQNSACSYLWDLKALAIREKKTFVIYPPDLEESSKEIFIDFEGLPEEGWIYLIGVVIKEEGKGEKAYSYWAENKAGEQQIFEQLFTLLINDPDAPIYHYGSYESQALRQSAKKWPGIFKLELPGIEKRLVNVLSYLRTHVYPPTYSNGLKEVAGFLGFNWRTPEADGVLSMKWRKDWEAGKDNNLKEKLQQYNIDDCQALIKVNQWLLQLTTDSKHDGVQRVADMRNFSPFKFKSNPEFGEDFNAITKASYFDYQRSKIYWRNQRNRRQTSTKDEKLHSGRGKHAWNPKRVNEIVVIPKLKKCPKCGHKKLYDCKDTTWKWRQTDLKFTASGVKQWVVEYQSWQVKCAECWKHFNNGVVRRMQFGDNLFAWATNLYVNYHLSHGKISRLLQEQFGILSTGMYFVDHQHKWWNKWQSEVDYLWQIILQSPVIHIDETTVKLIKRPRICMGLCHSTYCILPLHPHP